MAATCALEDGGQGGGQRMWNGGEETWHDIRMKSRVIEVEVASLFPNNGRVQRTMLKWKQ